MPSASDDTYTQAVFPPVPEFVLGCCWASLIAANVVILQGYGKRQQHNVFQIQVSERNKRRVSLRSAGGKNEK